VVSSVDTSGEGWVLFYVSLRGRQGLQYEGTYGGGQWSQGLRKAKIQLVPCKIGSLSQDWVTASC
jgi:hypothetical protein